MDSNKPIIKFDGVSEDILYDYESARLWFTRPVTFDDKIMSPS